MAEEAKIKYVDGKLAGEDLFTGKSQEKIAKSIYKSIKNNDIPEKIIGLEGVWGSGKSNLIKILETKIEGTHHIFTYDAWGHQEDLQRRAFLESLTEDLTKNNIIETKKWNGKLKHLLARKRETNQKTIPRLSWAIITLALITVLTPIFQQISNSFDGPSVVIMTEGNTPSESEFPWLKVLFTALPIITVLVVFAIVSLYHRRKRGEWLNISELFYLYKGKELEDTTHVTISEKEPTAREFKKWMSDLSEDLEKGLIVVFDNMDRLPPEKVKQLWSSIHTFFSEHSFKQIWAIVTFDREHLKSAFGSIDEVSDQFINKTFSVVFRVSPPVLTDWRQFFDLKFNEAFSDTEDSERDIVKRIYNVHHDNITPRGIIAFINELVSIRKTVRDEIRLRYIALFVSKKKEILQNPIDKILDLDFITKVEIEFKSDSNIQDNIAALVYNVPLSSASQVTLTREIEKAIDKQDYQRISQLTDHIHFLDILLQVLQKDDINIVNTAKALDNFKEEYASSDSVKPKLARIWDYLGKRFCQISIKEQQLKYEHKLLIRHLSEIALNKFLSHWIFGVSNSDKFNGKNFYRAIMSLRKYLDENNIEYSVFDKLVHRKVSPEVFLDYLSEAKDNWKALKLQCDETDLNNYLVGQLPDGLNNYVQLEFLKNEYDFSPVIEKIENLLSSVTVDSVEMVYTLYKAISKDKPIKLLEDGKIHQLLQSVEQDTEAYYDLIAMRMSRGSTFPGLGGISQQVINQTNDELVERITERIEYFASYGTILLNAKDWGSQLLKCIAKALTLKSYGTSRMVIVE